jgi:hypothetical protein
MAHYVVLHQNKLLYIYTTLSMRCISIQCTLTLYVAVRVYGRRARLLTLDTFIYVQQGEQIRTYARDYLCAMLRPVSRV